MISSVRSATKCNINRCVNYTFIWLYSTTNHIFVYVCVYVCVERTIITGLYVSEPKSPPPGTRRRVLFRTALDHV